MNIFLFIYGYETYEIIIIIIIIIIDKLWNSSFF
jgi:hypothetical protein